MSPVPVFLVTSESIPLDASTSQIWLAQIVQKWTSQPLHQTLYGKSLTHTSICHTQIFSKSGIYRFTILKSQKNKKDIEMKILLIAATPGYSQLNFLIFLNNSIFFCPCKILEKVSFGHDILEIFLIFFSCLRDFSPIFLCTTYGKCLNCKPCGSFKHITCAVAPIFSNQCNQNSIFCYDILYVIIQGDQQSGVVQSGKVRKKKGLFKISQKKSRNVWEFEKKISEVYLKRPGKDKC